MSEAYKKNRENSGTYWKERFEIQRDESADLRRKLEEAEATIKRSNLVETDGVKVESDSCGAPVLKRCGKILVHKDYVESVQQRTKDLQKMAGMARKLHDWQRVAGELAKHGAKFFPLFLEQGIAQTEYKEAQFMNSEDEHALAHRISELSCHIQDAEDAFNTALAAFRALSEPTQPSASLPTGS